MGLLVREPVGSDGGDSSHYKTRWQDWKKGQLSRSRNCILASINSWHPFVVINHPQFTKFAGGRLLIRSLILCSSDLYIRSNINTTTRSQGPVSSIHLMVAMPPSSLSFLPLPSRIHPSKRYPIWLLRETQACEGGCVVKGG